MRPGAALSALLLLFAPALWAAPARAAVAQEPAAADANTDTRDVLVMLRMPAPHSRPNGRYRGNSGDSAAQTARTRIARGIASAHGLVLVESWPMPLIGVDCFVMRVPPGRDVDEVLALLSRNDKVAWSQPLHTYHTRASAAVRPDPLFLTQPTASRWQLAELHKVATGKGVTVAVIDSKIETGHPDLAGQFSVDRAFMTARRRMGEQHGTGIAGVIAARAGNGLGIAGVAPQARLMALRACSQVPGPSGIDRANCDTLTLAKALHYAIDHGADVINLSLSGPRDPLLASLIELGIGRSIAVVAAFDPDLPQGGFPASQAGVIAIAEEALPSIPLGVYRAPGRDVPTTQPGGRWGLVSGNSFATAQVSGLLALVRERRRLDGPVRLARSSGGAVDACATLVVTSDVCNCRCALAQTDTRRAHR